jgi:predicted amidohydrolase
MAPLPSLAGACHQTLHLRFPEMIRRLALAGATALLVPAEWPRPRTGHWELLLRARAVENGLFVLGANRVGEQGGHVFEGASRIVDPWGQLLAEAGEAEGAFDAVVDPARVDDVRRRIPVLEDRVPEVDGAVDP